MFAFPHPFISPNLSPFPPFPSHTEFADKHFQQNGEQLNNLIKTLDGYYTNASFRATTDMPNRGEFVAYFIIFQLGNGGEVTKYLQQIRSDLLETSQVQFAIQVGAALKTENTAKFFKLLRKADVLQASLMHRYVGEVRLSAIRKMARSYCKGGGVDSYYPLSSFVSALMFDDREEAEEFLNHCGFEVSVMGVSVMNVSVMR